LKILFWKNGAPNLKSHYTENVSAVVFNGGKTRVVNLSGGKHAIGLNKTKDNS